MKILPLEILIGFGVSTSGYGDDERATVVHICRNACHLNIFLKHIYNIRSKTTKRMKKLFGTKVLLSNGEIIFGR